MEASLRKNLTGIDFTRIYQMCVKSAEHIFKITKEKHQQKFELLQKRAICGESNKHNRAGNSKWVINKSSTKLLPDEEEVLKLGLNFAPTPRTVPVVDLLAGVEVATRNTKLHAEEAEELRARICCIVKNTDIKQDNMIPSLRRALGSLKKNDSIVILKADKGNATVVLDKGSYGEKM